MAIQCLFVFFFFQAEDGIRDIGVTGVQTCALPISRGRGSARWIPIRRARQTPKTPGLLTGGSNFRRSRGWQNCPIARTMHALEIWGNVPEIQRRPAGSADLRRRPRSRAPGLTLRAVIGLAAPDWLP